MNLGKDKHLLTEHIHRSW